MSKKKILFVVLLSLLLLSTSVNAKNITFNRTANTAENVIEFFNNTDAGNVNIKDLKNLKPVEITENTGYYEARLEDSILFFSIDEQNIINYAYIEYKNGERFYILEKESEPRTIETIKNFIKTKGARSITENDFNYLKVKKIFEDGIFENQYILMDGTLTLLFRKDETVPFAITLVPTWE